MLEKNFTDRNILSSLVKILSYGELRKTAISCFGVIFNNFFILQFKAAFGRSKVKITNVEHPLDAEIPFDPSRIKIYMDFSAFWLRLVAFLLKRFGKKAIPEARKTMNMMMAIYRSAGSICGKNFSTTNRPAYYGSFGFVCIHLFDPHLMCVPSLHVMVVTAAFRAFEKSAEALDAREELAEETAWAKRYALDITESILYVKQHSVNCIPAAFFALSAYDTGLFSEDFIHETTAALFPERGKIQKHIAALYDDFISQNTGDPEKVLLNFLRDYVPDGVRV